MYSYNYVHEYCNSDADECALLPECGLMQSRARRGGKWTAGARLPPQLREHRPRVATTARAQITPSPILWFVVMLVNNSNASSGE